MHTQCFQGSSFMTDHAEEESSSVTKTPVRERLWTPIFIIIIICVLCCFLVGQGMSAGYSVFVDRIGGTSTIVGISATAYFLAAAVARVASGPCIDAKGRQFIMIIGDLFLLAGTFGPLFIYDGIVFIFWRILQGIGFALVGTAASTAAADVLPESRLGEGISYYGLGQAISMGVGPTIAIALASSTPPTNLFIGCAAFAVASTVFALLCRYEKNPTKLPATSVYRMRWEAGKVDRKEGGQREPEPSIREQAIEAAEKAREDSEPRWKKLVNRIFEIHALPAAITIAFMSTAFGFSLNFMGLYGTTIGVASPGIYFVVLSLSMITIRLTSGRFMDNTAPIKLMGIAAGAGILTYLIMLICFFLQETMYIDWLFYFAGVPFGVTMGIGMPVNQSMAVKMSPPARWGAANALYQLGLDVAIGVSSMFWGFFSDYFSFAVSLVGVMVLIAISFFVALAVYPKDDAAYDQFKQS